MLASVRRRPSSARWGSGGERERRASRVPRRKEPASGLRRTGWPSLVVAARPPRWAGPEADRARPAGGSAGGRRSGDGTYARAGRQAADGDAQAAATLSAREDALLDAHGYKAAALAMQSAALRATRSTARASTRALACRGSVEARRRQLDAAGDEREQKPESVVGNRVVVLAFLADGGRERVAVLPGALVRRRSTRMQIRACGSFPLPSPRLAPSPPLPLLVYRSE